MQSEARPRFSPLLHRVQQRHEDARAAGADRVADGHGAAVHVHLREVDLQLREHAEGLRGEGLVELPQADVFTSCRSSPAPSPTTATGPRPMMAGSTPAAAAPRTRAMGSRPSRALPRSPPRPPAPSLMPLALPAVTVPSFLKAGRAWRVHRGGVADVLVVVHDRVALLLRMITVKISSSKAPPAWAAAAFCWLATRTRPGPRARCRTWRRRSRR